MVHSGFRGIGNLSFSDQFLKKWHLLASTACGRKCIRYQWKTGLLMIHSTKRDWYWSFGCRGWSNHQDQWNFWWIEAVEVIEATEVIEAVEVIETVEVLRPGKSLLRSKESSKFLNSTLFWCFEKIFFLFESWNIMLNFSNFSARGCWGQPMSLFQKLITETQISNPPEPAMDHNSIKLMILLPFIAIYFRSFHYETPCNWFRSENDHSWGGMARRI